MEKMQKMAMWALSLVLIIAFALASTAALQRTAAPDAVAVGTPVSLGNVTVEADRMLTPTITKDEILWLARVIYSETKQPHEQELVAWVVRNRKETGYRGNESYKDVVLDPWQFSAFNRNSPKRSYYARLSPASEAAGFQRAYQIAERVAMAPPAVRPFDTKVRHFYSERSMRGGRKPAWARNKRPVQLDRKVDPRRFRFYAQVS